MYLYFDEISVVIGKVNHVHKFKNALVQNKSK